VRVHPLILRLLVARARTAFSAVLTWHRRRVHFLFVVVLLPPLRLAFAHASAHC
jgi:hypothetical protein